MTTSVIWYWRSLAFVARLNPAALRTLYAHFHHTIRRVRATSNGDHLGVGMSAFSVFNSSENVCKLFNARPRALFWFAPAPPPRHLRSELCFGSLGAPGAGRWIGNANSLRPPPARHHLRSGLCFGSLRAPAPGERRWPGGEARKEFAFAIHRPGRWFAPGSRSRSPPHITRAHTQTPNIAVATIRRDVCIFQH